MLSIENPPPDPPRPCQFLPLKSDSDEIERPPHKLPLPEVDLLKQPSLDHHHHHHRYHTPLPKFSIRDYVFTVRSKDIKKNWPFSPKNLQLCLKHGLKDPLPPFEPLDTVRNQSLKRCTVESNSFEKQSTRKFDEAPSGSNDHVVLESSNDAHSNHNLSGACVENTSSRSGEHEIDLPSTTASVSQSEIDSVLIDKPSNLPLDSDTSVEASPEVKAAGSFKSQRTENITRPSSKKCRLIVKFSSHSDRSSTEDIASNCTIVSESMASKVCPVCKTFSSSSNTTLNAHIDQCLSVESTPKWRADSKLTRHRIKPRKTRLMVDVYATAKPCTLEELDRRNGTSWATASNIPRQDYERVETSDEGKKQRVSPIYPDNNGDVGAVYIDANGTKLRILSKFDDVPPLSKVGKDLGPHRSFKGGKGSKFLSTKRKRRHAPKNNKYLKLAPESRKVFSNKTRSSTIVRGQEGYCGVEESYKREGSPVLKQIKISDSRSTRGRLLSKRSGLSRKPNNQEGHQPLICKWHVGRDLQVQSDQSHQGDNVVERHCVRKFKVSSESSVSSPEKCENIEKPINEAPVIDNKREHSFGRKRVRSPLFGAQISDKVCRSFHPRKQKAIQLSKENLYGNEDHMVRSLNSGGNCTSSSSKKMVNVDANSNLDTPETATTISHHSFATKCFRISSPKKNTLSASSRSSMVESRSNMVKKFPTKESRLHLMAEIDEEVAGSSAEGNLECDLAHDGAKIHHGRNGITEVLSFGGSSVQGAGERRGRVNISGRDETLALKSLQPAPYCYDHDERENTDSSARGNDDILDKVDGLESVEETVTNLSQSIETNFKKLSNPSKNKCNSSQNVEDYKGALCGDEGLTDPSSRPSLVDKPNMFCAEVGNGIIAQTADMGGELSCDAAQVNSFPEVDPIPIPGPPGSFLPSPRDMSSDDFQGNSSLTTSRVQSSQDQLDFVDGESSDSPISTVSTISNCAEARSGLKYAEPSAFIGAPATEKGNSGCSSAMFKPLVENGAANPQISSGLERTYEGEKFRVPKISIEKKPFVFKNDDLPCCCQRKERSSQGFALNYQESELLRRRTLASTMVPAAGMQTGANPNIRPYKLDTTPETFSLSSSVDLGSEQIVRPLMKPPAGPIPLKGYPDAGVKFSSRGGCDSASPSNPILRLMGKNLMVVNKEEEGSVPLGVAQSSAQNNHLTSNFSTSSGISPTNVRNQGGCLSFHHNRPQGSLIFDRNSNDLLGQSFDVQTTNGYRKSAKLATPQTPVQFQPGMFLNGHMDCGFTPSMGRYKCEDNYNLPSQLNRPKNKPGAAAMYEMGKVRTVDGRQQDGDSAVSIKEVIVIDDAPETEINKTTDIAKQPEGLRERQLVSYGLSMPLVPAINIVRPANPFSVYHQSEELPLLSDPTTVHNNNLHGLPFGRGNISPVNWDCTSEGSSALQRGPYMALSPSTSQLGSALYYSTSLS